MSRPLMGGSAIAVALLSLSLTFHAEPTVAEPLASAIPKPLATQNTTRPAAALSEQLTAEVGESDDDSGSSVETDKASAPVLPEGKTTGSVEIVTPITLPQTFEATAYSLPGKTASGKLVARGIIAADRRVLPLGTRVRLEAGPYSGEYLVADTGGTIRGHEIDIWMPSSSEALRFGRRKVKLTILSRAATRESSKRLRKG